MRVIPSTLRQTPRHPEARGRRCVGLVGRSANLPDSSECSAGARIARDRTVTGTDMLSGPSAEADRFLPGLLRGDLLRPRTHQGACASIARVALERRALQE